MVEDDSFTVDASDSNIRKENTKVKLTFSYDGSVTCTTPKFLKQEDLLFTMNGLYLLHAKEHCIVRS